jgi:major membrane immunogen (membrane-anchored lipoprotein)
MSRTMSTVMIAMLLALGGCESSAGSAALGGVAGAAAGAGGYEFHLNRQKSRVEQDLKDGKIDKREHDIRIDQIKRDSFIQ